MADGIHLINLNETCVRFSGHFFFFSFLILVDFVRLVKETGNRIHLFTHRSHRYRCRRCRCRRFLIKNNQPFDDAY